MSPLEQRKLTFYAVQQTAAQLETVDQLDLQYNESKNDDHNENTPPTSPTRSDDVRSFLEMSNQSWGCLDKLSKL